MHIEHLSLDLILLNVPSYFSMSSSQNVAEHTGVTYCLSLFFISSFCFFFSLNMDRVVAVKYLFGLPHDVGGMDGFSGNNIKYVEELTSLLGSMISENEYSAASDMNSTLNQV